MFLPGRDYRRPSLDATCGGQRQGGISTPASPPLHRLAGAPWASSSPIAQTWTIESRKHIAEPED
jgi:hypothetical protein